MLEHRYGSCCTYSISLVLMLSFWACVNHSCLAPRRAFKLIVLLYFFHITVLCRYRVVYRLVNTVYVMAVASAAANVFSLMKLVDAITRVATLASRGVEVTPEKLSRRYPEVYRPAFLNLPSACPHAYCPAPC